MNEKTQCEKNEKHIFNENRSTEKGLNIFALILCIFESIF